MTYTNYSGNFSNVAFFNDAPTRPPFLNITDQVTYVQFQGMFQFVCLCVCVFVCLFVCFISFILNDFFPFLTTGCYQFSTSCDICPTTAFGKWSKLEQQFSNVHCWYLTIFFVFLYSLHSWLTFIFCDEMVVFGVLLVIPSFFVEQLLFVLKIKEFLYKYEFFIWIW
jgi:hypothetical protein